MIWIWDNVTLRDLAIIFHLRVGSFFSIYLGQEKHRERTWLTLTASNYRLTTNIRTRYFKLNKLWKEQLFSKMDSSEFLSQYKKSSLFLSCILMYFLSLEGNKIWSLTVLIIFQNVMAQIKPTEEKGNDTNHVSKKFWLLKKNINHHVTHSSFLKDTWYSSKKTLIT